MTAHHVPTSCDCWTDTPYPRHWKASLPQDARRHLTDPAIECRAFTSPEQRKTINGTACDGCARTPTGWGVAAAPEPAQANRSCFNCGNYDPHDITPCIITNCGKTTLSGWRPKQ